MKTFGFGVLIAFAALVFVIGSELAVTTWLSVAPLDVTGNFYLTAVFPVHLIIQGILISTLAPVFGHKPVPYILLYAVLASAAYAAMLNTFANPPWDIVRYEISALLCMVIWLGVNRRRIFTSPGTHPL